MILKIDFEKAFDTLDHDAILQVLKAKGFPDLFLIWIKEILSSGSSSILLNGLLGNRLSAEEAFDKVILCHHFCLLKELIYYRAW